MVPLELSDLHDDPQELNNLAELPVHAESICRMAQQIEEHRRTMGQP